MERLPQVRQGLFYYFIFLGTLAIARSNTGPLHWDGYWRFVISTVYSPPNDTVQIPGYRCGVWGGGGRGGEGSLASIPAY